jgi:hypothetical protein
MSLLPAAVTVLPSADQRHLLASERVGGGGPEDPEYRWSIFSMATGQRIGRLFADVSGAPFFVWGDAIVFEHPPYGRRSGDDWLESPLQVRSVLLASGDLAWERPVRDLEYRGPLPPAR